MMDTFTYDSQEFRRELEKSPHHAGEVSFLRSIAKPGMIAIEAGANRGVTTVALAKAIGEMGHVYVFEPVPEYYSQLAANVSRNRVSNISTYQLALSNQTARIPFYKRDGGGSGITPAPCGEMLWVEATTIAEFLTVEEIHTLDLLTLDCEGSELLVLQGAQAALEKHEPEIFCEIHHGYLDELGQSVDDVVGFLRQFGYDIRMLQVEDPAAEATEDECSHVYAHVSKSPL